MSNEAKTSEAVKSKEELVEIGPVPYDESNPTNKTLLISCNGETIMVERGQRHKVPKRFATVYEHRIAMRGRKIAERERRARELREKQNQEGISFM